MHTCPTNAPTQSEQSAQFILHFSDEDRIQGCVPVHAAIAALVDEVVVAHMVQQVAPFDHQQQVVIPFIQVDDSQTVDLGASWVLLEQCIDHTLPSFIRVSKLEGVIHQCQVASQYSVQHGLKLVFPSDPGSSGCRAQ